jgi:cbb3-type cytochrome oxidase subunit 3
MYKDVLRSMDGIELFPSISLILFFSFFIIMVIYLIRTGKEFWTEAANIPLDSEKIFNPKNSDK